MLANYFRPTLFDKTRYTDLRHHADIDRVETMIQRRRLRWLGHVQRMEYSRLPKQMLVSKIEDGKRLQKRQKQRWHNIMNADLKSLDMVSTWRSMALARNDWRNNIHSKQNELNQVEKINEKVKKENKESETYLECSHCNKLCSNKTELANHIRLLHTKVFQETSIFQYCCKQFK